MSEIANNNPFGNRQREQSWGHATQKPVECMRRPIVNNSRPGELVYDPLGSHTTRGGGNPPRGLGVKVSGEKWALGALPEISIGTAMVTSGPMAVI